MEARRSPYSSGCSCDSGSSSSGGAVEMVAPAYPVQQSYERVPAGANKSATSSAASVVANSRVTHASKESSQTSYFFAPQFGSTALEVLAQYQDIWMLGITIVVGGQYFDWNEGVKAGFGNFLVAAVITAAAYICLCFCLAEMTSILPFSGGSYGFARVSLNIFGGYMVGFCEALEYLTYVATSVFALGKMITLFLGLPKVYEPIYWFLFYVTSIGIQLNGGKFFWRVNTCLAVISVLVIFLYCTACIPIMDFTENARLKDSSDPWFGGRSGFNFMHVLPLASWFFVGIEAVPLAGQETHQPKLAMPKGIIFSVLTISCTSLAIMFCTAAVGPSAEELSKALSPLSYGLARTFNITQAQTVVLIAPAVFSTAHGFLFACGRQVWAMAESGLLPAQLRWTVPSRGTPYMALLCPSIIGFGFLLVTWFNPWMERVLFNTCILGSYMSYLASFVSFISFRLFYPGLDKNYTYRSPLGLTGAVVGMCIFIVCIIAVAFFQDDGGLSIFFFLGYIAIATAFYFIYARRTQRFSPMEKSVMMIAHVLKADRTKKKERPGRLPSKEEVEGLWPQLRQVFRNRWQRSRSGESHFGKDSSVARVSSIGPIQAVNVSVNESEPFYERNRMEPALGESQSKSVWASVRDALAVVVVSAPSGAPATPVGSHVVSPYGSRPGSQWDSVNAGHVGIEMVYPVLPPEQDPVVDNGAPSRDGNGLSIWTSMRETLGTALAGIAVGSPSMAVGSRRMSPASSVVSSRESVSVVSESDAAGRYLGDSPVAAGAPPRHPPTSSSNKTLNIWDSIRDALGGQSSSAAKHYVTPNMSRETSDVDVNSLPSPPGSVGNQPSFPGGEASSVEYMIKREPIAQTPLESYDNSARISICSVEEDPDGARHHSNAGGDFTPSFGFGVLSSLMAIAAGGSGAVAGAPSLESSNQSSKCPSAGSGDHHRAYDPSSVPHGMRTPMSETSEDNRRAGVVASARSSGHSTSLWVALRDSLGMTLTNTSRQSSAHSLDTSALSSKYTSTREDVLNEDGELGAARPYLRTESLDYSGEENQHQHHTATDKVNV